MIGLLQSFVTYILPVLFVLGVVVTIHELGHFLVARWCGVAVDRFSIGFGKPIVSWRDRSGVDWRISWIPLGGYVKFAGDDNAASVPDSSDLKVLRRRIETNEGPEATRKYFHFKPVWQRALVTAAGPMANFILAAVIFAVLAGAVGENVTPPRVDQVVAGSPAEAAGLRPGDEVVRVQGRRVYDFQDLAQMIQLRPGKETRLEVRRAGETIFLTATPRSVAAPKQVGAGVRMGQLGLGNTSVEHVSYTPLQAAGYGVVRTWRTLDTTVFILGQMITGQISPAGISGVVGIAHTSGEVAKASVQGAPDTGAAAGNLAGNMFYLVAIISVSIGFMNLLPVPVLDGGHLLFYAYEALARRPVGAKVQAAGYRVGLALLLGLMVFATFNDLQRLRVFQILGGLFS